MVGQYHTPLALGMCLGGYSNTFIATRQSAERFRTKILRSKGTLLTPKSDLPNDRNVAISDRTYDSMCAGPGNVIWER